MSLDRGGFSISPMIGFIYLGRAPKRKDRLPTTIVQGPVVSFIMLGKLFPDRETRQITVTPNGGLFNSGLGIIVFFAQIMFPMNWTLVKGGGQYTSQN